MRVLIHSFDFTLLRAGHLRSYRKSTECLEYRHTLIILRTTRPTQKAKIEHPDPFLVVRIHRSDLLPPLTGVCAGYELNEWRCKQLAAHLMEWLPEFALTPGEREALRA